MVTFTWKELKHFIGCLDTTLIQIVSLVGDAEYPAEWAWARKNQPTDGERYVLVGGIVWVVNAAGTTRLWVIRPAPRIHVIAQGTDPVIPSLTWTYTSDARLAIDDTATGARWVFRMVSGLAVVTYRNAAAEAQQGPVLGRVFALGNKKAIAGLGRHLPAKGPELPKFLCRA